jgi:hypothetical protein
VTDELKRKIASAENMAVRQRNYRRARDRALTRLANDYKEIYLEYLAEEKEKDEAQGKRWTNLAHSLPDFGDNITHNSVSKAGGDTSDISQDKGDNE